MGINELDKNIKKSILQKKLFQKQQEFYNAQLEYNIASGLPGHEQQKINAQKTMEMLTLVFDALNQEYMKLELEEV